MRQTSVPISVSTGTSDGTQSAMVAGGIQSPTSVARPTFSASLPPTTMPYGAQLLQPAWPVLVPSVSPSLMQTLRPNW